MRKLQLSFMAILLGSVVPSSEGAGQSAAGRWVTTVTVASRPADLLGEQNGWSVSVARLGPKPALRQPVLPNRPLALTDGRHGLEGIASFYWQDQMTANGERFDKTAMTAAHKTLPFGTKVRVTNVVNGRTVIVRINDRGPFKPGRIIDLSLAAAEIIDMRRSGLVPVKVEVLR